MDRRLSGALLLIVAVVLVAVGSRFTSSGVVGQASAESAGRPLVVGDCLLDGPSTDTGVDMFGGSSPTLEDCSALHRGEVYAVFDGADLTPAGATDRCFSSFDPYGYMGLVDGAGPDTWTPSWNVLPSLVLPGERDYRVGQRWAACAIFVPEGNSAVARSMSDLFPDGPFPPSLGFCTDASASNNYHPVGCAEPHPAELFGSRYFEQLSASAEELYDMCLTYAVALTGRADLGSISGLEVVAHAQVYDATGQGVTEVGSVESGQRGLILCEVLSTGGRQFTESLLSLGDAPMPWV